MILINNTKCKNTAEVLQTAYNVASHFNFDDLDTVLNRYKPAIRLPAANSIDYIHPHEKKLLSLTRQFVSHQLQKDDPIDLIPEFIHTTDIPNKKSVPTQFGLHITGSSNTMSEASLIATATAILEDIGITDYTVHINSIGNNDSLLRFTRDVGLFLRKSINGLPTHIRDEVRINPLRALYKLVLTDNPIVSDAPNPTDYLNEEGRRKLWELLEYMEAMDISFALDPTIIGSPDCFEHILFEIRDNNKDTSHVLARGGRYDALSRKAFKRQSLATGLIFDIESKGALKPKKSKSLRPTFYLVHLSKDARLATLPIINTLRKAGIKTEHHIAHNTITKQIEHGSREKYPYIIVVGHEEAAENSVIVRNQETLVQKVVPVKKLSAYLKRLNLS